MGSRRTTIARFAAPAAFLLAATIGILLVRSAISDPTADTSPVPVTTTATTTAGPTTTGATTEPEEPPTSTTAEGEFYEIQSGDTLETIAVQYSTTVEQLLVLNPDVDPVALSIGQRIRVE